MYLQIFFLIFSFLIPLCSVILGLSIGSSLRVYYFFDKSQVPCKGAPYKRKTCITSSHKFRPCKSSKNSSCMIFSVYVYYILFSFWQELHNKSIYIYTISSWFVMKYYHRKWHQNNWKYDYWTTFCLFGQLVGWQENVTSWAQEW